MIHVTRVLSSLTTRYIFFCIVVVIHFLTVSHLVQPFLLLAARGGVDPTLGHGVGSVRHWPGDEVGQAGGSERRESFVP